MNVKLIDKWSAGEITGIAQQAPVQSAEEIASSLPNELKLWSDWDGEDGKKVIRETFLGKGDNVSSSARDRVLDHIQNRRESLIAFVESLPNKFKLSVRV